MSRTQQPRQYFAANHRAIVNAIEWEELPSLSNRLVIHDVSAQARGANDSRFQGSNWGETLPASLDMPLPSAPFVESLTGLATREVVEPDIFRHFFGPSAVN
jgi:hypothetical protein